MARMTFTSPPNRPPPVLGAKPMPYDPNARLPRPGPGPDMQAFSTPGGRPATDFGGVQAPMPALPLQGQSSGPGEGGLFGVGQAKPMPTRPEFSPVVDDMGPGGVAAPRPMGGLRPGPMKPYDMFRRRLPRDRGGR